MRQKEEPTRRPEGGTTDQVGIGPRDMDGAAASEFPDHGRGSVETDPGKELGRRLPGQTGGEIGEGTDVGLAGEPPVADARQHGNRKKN